MAINRYPTTTLLAHDAKSGAAGSATRIAAVWRQLAHTWKIRSKTGWAALAILVSGTVFAFFCTAWAIREGVAFPLAIMVGHCTLISSACLFAAVLVIQNLAVGLSDAKVAREPNYAAWKLVSRLSVSDASRLWCNIEPGFPETPESIAWAHAMLDAIKQGALPIVERASVDPAAAGREQTSPTWRTEVTRESLVAWARAHGHSPRFLRD